MLENEILMSIRASKNKGEISLQTPWIDKEGNEIRLDILGTDPDQFWMRWELRLQTKKLYQKMKTSLALRTLSIEMRYGLCNGQNMTERIAQILDI